ncbi:MAG TPA: hypothetical protein VGH81_14265 [Rudaea sp.]
MEQAIQRVEASGRSADADNEEGQGSGRRIVGSGSRIDVGEGGFCNALRTSARRALRVVHESDSPDYDYRFCEDTAANANWLT